MSKTKELEFLKEEEVIETVEQAENGELSVYEALARLKVRAQESQEKAKQEMGIEEDPFECPF